MRFYWTTETFGYALRDPRTYTRAMITSPWPWEGFYGCIFQRNLPDSGPYKTRQEAADWVQRMLPKLDHTVPADSTFAELPPWQERERPARPALAETA